MDYEKEINNLLASYDSWWDKGFETPKMSNKLYPYTSILHHLKLITVLLKIEL